MAAKNRSSNKRSHDQAESASSNLEVLEGGDCLGYIVPSFKAAKTKAGAAATSAGENTDSEPNPKDYFLASGGYASVLRSSQKNEWDVAATRSEVSYGSDISNMSYISESSIEIAKLTIRSEPLEEELLEKFPDYFEPSELANSSAGSEIINFRPFNQKPTFKFEQLETSSVAKNMPGFLAQMAAANAELDADIAAGRAADRRMEINDADSDNDNEKGIKKDEDEDQYIEINLGLGVLEEKNGDLTSSDGESEDVKMGNNSIGNFIDGRKIKKATSTKGKKAAVVKIEEL